MNNVSIGRNCDLTVSLIYESCQSFFILFFYLNCNKHYLTLFDIHQNVCICDNAKINDNCRLKNCNVAPGHVVPEGSVYFPLLVLSNNIPSSVCAISLLLVIFKI